MEFEKIIQKYLDELAKKSPEFAAKYSNQKKSIKECCQYIGGEMRKKAFSGISTVEDDEVYYLARHYYEEEDLKVGKGTFISDSSFVHSVKELTEEDKNKAIQKGKELAEKEYKAALEKAEQAAKEKELTRLKKAEEKQKEKSEAELAKIKKSGQMFLFDL